METKGTMVEWKMVREVLRAEQTMQEEDKNWFREAPGKNFL
jgi:hypothetical protein